MESPLIWPPSVDRVIRGSPGQQDPDSSTGHPILVLHTALQTINRSHPVLLHTAVQTFNQLFSELVQCSMQRNHIRSGTFSDLMMLESVPKMLLQSTSVLFYPSLVSLVVWTFYCKATFAFNLQDGRIGVQTPRRALYQSKEQQCSRRLPINP